MPLPTTHRSWLRALPALLLVLAALAVVGPLTGGASAGTRVWGVDVADYQHPNGAAINWSAVRSDGASFAMVKATEGTSYTNPYFASDWAGIRRAGLVRAAYAFARPALPYSTAVDQARYFLRVVGSTDEQGDLPPMLDLEVTGGLSPSELATWTRTWLQTVASLTGRTPMLYAGQYFWQDQVGDASGFTGYLWWLPAYSSAAPRAPFAGGWSHWTMWQYTSGASVPGIVGRVDASDFDGSSAQLASLADGRNTLIAQRYARLRGVLGAPTSPVEAIAGGGFGQTYRDGAITEVGGAVHAAWGPTGARYLELGAWRGLGALTRDTTANSGGSLAMAGGGWLLAPRGRPAYLISGALLTGFISHGGLRGLGYPLADAAAVGYSTPAGNLAPVTGGLEQPFAAADLLSSSKSGTHAVGGAFLTLYHSLQGPDGVLGMPTSDAHAGPLGDEVDFQLGSMVYVPALGRAVVG